MQHSGFKELLVKRRQQQQQQQKIPTTAQSAEATSATPPSTTAPSTVVAATDDPYAAAIQSALASRQAPVHTQATNTRDSTLNPSAATVHSDNCRKRSRSPDNKVERDDNTTLGESAESMSAAAVAAVSKPPLCSAKAIKVEREAALTALSCAMRYTSEGWGGQRLQIPKSLQQWLLARYVEESSISAFTSVSEESATIFLDGHPEGVLLNAMAAELKDYMPMGGCQKLYSSPPPSSLPSSPSDKMQELADLIHSLWYLLAGAWRCALRGSKTDEKACGSGNDERETDEAVRVDGWCHSLYLLSCNALPTEVKIRFGHQIALGLERWRAAQRSRECAFELLAFLLRDWLTFVERGEKEKGEGANKHGCAADGSGDDDGLIVPRAVREGLFRMMVLHAQHQKNFGAARQDYVDMTLGTANWKIGLFSAGEVHMRRSIERVDRNRISHILNNERAMHMLHAAKELLIYAEKGLMAEESKAFFFPFS